jgi:hypothetical protein
MRSRPEPVAVGGTPPAGPLLAYHTIIIIVCLDKVLNVGMYPTVPTQVVRAQKVHGESDRIGRGVGGVGGWRVGGAKHTHALGPLCLCCAGPQQGVNYI